MSTHARKALQTKNNSILGARLYDVDVREFARLTGIVNYFCIVLALSHTTRLFLDALIFLGDGDFTKWIGVSDLRLGYYVRAEQRILKDKTLKPIRDTNGKGWIVIGGKKISESSLCKWIGRQRKTLVAEQDRAGITLVEVKTGGHKNGENRPTEYRLPLFALIQDVQDLLANNNRLDEKTHAVIESEIWKAVLSVLESERKNVQRKVEEVRFKRPKETPGKYANLCIAYYRKALDMCFKDLDRFEKVADFIQDEQSKIYIERAQMKRQMEHVHVEK